MPKKSQKIFKGPRLRVMVLLNAVFQIFQVQLEFLIELMKNFIGGKFLMAESQFLMLGKFGNTHTKLRFEHSRN